MDELVFDIEGDGLDPTKIWCLCAEVGGKIKSTTSYEHMIKVLQRPDIIIGHNITRWDVPVLERLLNIKIKAKIVDTLALSWYLYPKRIRHGLADWGEEFGVPKPKIDDWFNLPIEEYINRCKEDVKINVKLWKKQKRDLIRIYGSEEKAWLLIDYLIFKMDCAREQERSRWRVDVELATNTLEKLSERHQEATRILEAVMPQVPKKAFKERPKSPFKRDGSVSVQGAKWFALLKKEGLPDDYFGRIEVITSYDEPNANSPDQIKNWLYSLGWVPETFDYKRDKETGDVRKVEQVRKEVDQVKELCPSVKKLYKKEPNLKYLEEITTLAHRIPIVKGFLEKRDENDTIAAEIGGITNTLRFKHRVIVNLPGVDRPWGKEIRGCLIAPDGYELCGSDQSSLEDRTKQHYMWDYDPEYVKEMNTPDFDPHIDLGVLANMITPEQGQAYKNGDKSVKSIRHKAKTTNYSCTYGIGIDGIVRDTGMQYHEASTLHATYWRRNWSIKAIADDCIVKTIGNQKWLFCPVSGLWYSLRHEKDRFSTLNQGTGTYCFDVWLMQVKKKRSQMTAQFHDEVVLCILKGFRDKAEKMLREAMKEANKILNLNRELDIDVQFGDNYAEIH